MFDWDDLRYFLEVARTESVSRAALSLRVNHTTVARRIKSLEERLSAQLFEKMPSGYKLTDTGLQLVQAVSRIETECIAIQEQTSGENMDVSGVVSLSLPEGFGSHFIVPRLHAFYEKYPNIQLDVVALPHTLSVSKREAHIAVSLTEPTVGRLISRLLTRFSLHLYAAESYLQRYPPIARIDELSGHNLITPVVSRPENLLIKDLIPEPESNLRLKSINAQLEAVEAGLGVSLLPYFMAAARPHLIPILPQEAVVRRTFWLSMHEDMRHITRVKAVWDWLKDVVRTNQAALHMTEP